MRFSRQTEPTEEARYLPSYDCVKAAPYAPCPSKFFVFSAGFMVNFISFR
jgi:hypothetical protein